MQTIICSSLPIFFSIFSPLFLEYELSIDVEGIEQYTGRLLITYANVTGRICGNDQWDDTAALVACRELGYTHGIAYYHSEGTDRFLDTDGPIWLTNLQCSGDEERLVDCQHPGWGKVTECTGNSAGVLCMSDQGMLEKMATQL